MRANATCRTRKSMRTVTRTTYPDGTIVIEVLTTGDPDITEDAPVPGLIPEPAAS